MKEDLSLMARAVIIALLEIEQNAYTVVVSGNRIMGCGKILDCIELINNIESYQIFKGTLYVFLKVEEVFKGSEGETKEPIWGYPNPPKPRGAL